MNSVIFLSVSLLHLSKLSLPSLQTPYGVAENKRNPPFRGEHLGSLLLPKEFLAKRSAFLKSELSQVDLTAAEDESITKVVKVQTDIDLRAVTDGEYQSQTTHYPTSIFPESELTRRQGEDEGEVVCCCGCHYKGSWPGKRKSFKPDGSEPAVWVGSHEEGNVLGWEDMKRKLWLVRSISDDGWPNQPQVVASKR